MIATIVIITVIVGFLTISNYSKRKKVMDLDKLKEELEIEGEKVLDYAVYSAVSPTDIEDYMESFVGSYSDYSEEDVNLYFIFGNSDKIIAIAYQSSSSDKIYVDVGAGDQPVSPGNFEEFLSPSIGDINMMIGQDVYAFEIKEEGEHFYFVISKEIGGEKYVITN